MKAFEVCATCGGWIFRDDLLCDFCWRKFIERVHKDGPVTRRDPLFVQSLWSWDRQSEELSRAIVYSLKGNFDPQRWKQLAAVMLSVSLRLPPNACFVPIPSKRWPEGDHALGLARALSELTNVPLITCLASEAQRSQRGLNRKERGQIRFKKKGRLPRSRFVVLIDDVVTSGATLVAASKALRRKDPLQAWCLMDRRLVADFR